MGTTRHRANVPRHGSSDGGQEEAAAVRLQCLCADEKEMSEQEIEQMTDIKWAETVLSGNGLSIDTRDAANAVLTALVEQGASEEIRKLADRLLHLVPPLRMVCG